MKGEAIVLEKEFSAFIESLNVGKADKHGNLRVFPIFSEGRDENGYALLDEAVRTGKFVVEEISEGGSVPELMARNLMSDLDVLLLLLIG